MLFIYNCTRKSWVYFLKRKSEVLNIFVKFYKVIQTQFNKQIHILRSDNGEEHMKLDMKEFITSDGLIQQTSCSSTPQQNGIAERKNHTLLEMARSLMFESHVPAYFWPEVVATSNYLTNHTLPTKWLHFKTPLEALNFLQLYCFPIIFHHGCLVVLFMLILRKEIEINCNIEQLSVCLLDMVFIKRVIDVLIQFMIRCIL